MAVSGTSNTVAQMEPAPKQLAAVPGNAKRDCGGHSFGLRIDTRYRPVALVQSPGRTRASCQKSRHGANRYCGRDIARFCVDGSQQICGSTGDPHCAFTEARIVGTRRDGNSLPDMVRSRIDSNQGTGVIADDPDALSASRDSAFRSGWSTGKNSADPVGMCVNTRKRGGLSAQWYPEAAKAERQARARITRQQNDGNFFVGLGIDPVNRWRLRAGNPDRIVCDLHPVRVFTDFEYRFGFEEAKGT
jgi:hypothetical protein